MARIFSWRRFGSYSRLRSERSEQDLAAQCSQILHTIGEFEAPIYYGGLREYTRRISDELVTSKIFDSTRKDWHERKAFFHALVSEAKVRFPEKFMNRP